MRSTRTRKCGRRCSEQGFEVTDITVEMMPAFMKERTQEYMNSAKTLGLPSSAMTDATATQPARKKASVGGARRRRKQPGAVAREPQARPRRWIARGGDTRR
jgi:hypothetical protein